MDILVAARSIMDARNLVTTMIPDAKLFSENQQCLLDDVGEGRRYYLMLNHAAAGGRKYDRAVVLVGDCDSPKFREWVSMVATWIRPGGTLTVLL